MSGPDDPGLAARNAQHAAADPSASVFVTANAGSGKTKVLIDRIARLLLSGSPPSSFLCITYTKAAAAEMQRRLFDRLGGWCVAPDETLMADLAALMGDEAAARENMGRARALFARALETPGGLKIQTIHAFCERLLARFPLEAKAPPGFDIADEAAGKALIAAAWAEVFAKGDADVTAALDRFSARLDQSALQALFDRLVNERGALARMSAGHDDPKSAARAIRARFGPITTAAAVHENFLARTSWEDVLAAAAALDAGSATDRACADKLYQAKAQRAIEPYFSVFLTEKGDPRLKLGTKGLRDANAFLVRFLDVESQRVMEAVAAAKAAERGCDAEAAALLGGALNAAYSRMKDDRGYLDFDDLIARSRALLEDEAAAPWVLFKLDGGIDHILIDEGQDTSPDQWSLLAPLQEEFFAGEGARGRLRTVFAVGDPKQSIYSFQGADPARFQAEGRALASRADGAQALFRAPELKTSFRSAGAVLEAVDAVFQTLQAVGDPPEQFNRISHLVWRAGAAGVCEWWPLCLRPERQPAVAWDAPLDLEPENSAPARLAGRIAETIRTWIDRGEAISVDVSRTRPMSAGDVLILVRQRGPLFRQLIKACKRAGLPVAGADRLVLGDEIAAQDLLTLIRVALDPFDDLALACLLKGPFVGLSDDVGQILPLAADREHEPLWRRLQANEDPVYAPARALVERLISGRGLSAFAFLSSALEAFDEDGVSGWRRLLERLGAEARDPVEEVLARALAAPGRGASGLQAFLAQIEADDAPLKREMDAGGDVVRIMTVHGAKGLEAPVVFLPDAAAAPKLDVGAGLMLDEAGLAFSPSRGEDDARAAQMRQIARKRLLGEHWRLLYVAMTRARDRLIVCGHASGASQNAAADSWHVAVQAAIAPIAEQCETPFGDGLRLGSPPPALGVRAGGAADGSPAPRPVWLDVAAEAGSRPAARPSHAASGRVVSPRAGADLLARGRLIHGLLQRLPEIEPSRRLAAAMRWLERHGAGGARGEALALEALNVIDDARFAAAFAPDSRAEVAIVGTVNGAPVRGVIDRLAVTADEALIVDFKSDRPPPHTAEDTPLAYVRQLALYRELTRQALAGRTVRCALVFTHAPRLIALGDAAMDAALAGVG